MARKKIMALDPDDIHNEKLGKSKEFLKYPHCIYFYYIGPLKTDGYNTVLHYYDPGGKVPLDTAALQTKIEALIKNARIRNLRDQRPPPNGENWKNVVWDRISYVVFAFDIQGIKFIDPEILVDQKFGGTYNWSFFDAEKAKTVKNCKVIIYINHMKADEPFNEILFDAQYFHFDLLTDPELEWPGKRRYPDSGGTNMGPPVPPP